MLQTLHQTIVGHTNEHNFSPKSACDLTSGVQSLSVGCTQNGPCPTEVTIRHDE